MAGIFKAYDIRGIVPEELDRRTAYLVGRALGVFLGAGPLVVSRDMRLSGPEIAGALIEGITDSGRDVVDAGLLSTPANYFTIGHYGYPGGAQVTASHNPKQYNGFKMSREQAIPLSYETGIAEIERMVTENRFPPAARKGKVGQRDVQPDYTEHVLSFAHDIKPLKLVIDAGNGMAGKMLPPILGKLPCEVVELYFEPDGTFPNHDANPLKDENLEELRRTVVKEQADLGIAFDGDADRVGFVDETGTVIPNDLAGALIARQVLSEETGATIIYDPRSSWAVKEEITAAGGTPHVERVGHAYMKATMRKLGAPFGLELSGHFYFRDNFCADSGVIAMIAVLNLLSRDGVSMSALIKPLKRYHSTGEINFEVQDKDAKIEEVSTKFSDGRQSRVDGVTVEYDNWWFNVRKSNTEPLLRLLLEGRTLDQMKEGYARVQAVLGEPEKP
ncbi:MAG TPA: phosphomannomutase/phosphoglucomutase [Planctomycetota bacterium]|nr:phosphomannomutase/phosphoglucomutase [Planctomycetota bacterium]